MVINAICPRYSQIKSYQMNYTVAKRLVSIIASCALVLLTLPACAANPFATNNGRSGSIQRKRDVTLTISASQSSFAANEPVLIEFTLRNNDPKRSARILDWDIPCDDEDGISSSSEDSVTEMSFFKIATSGGQVAKYLGALLKRAAPSDVNYKRLKSGEQVSCTIDLGQYFEFKSSDGDDTYIIKYSVTSMELSKPNSVNTTNALEILESNTLTIKIGDRPNPFQRNLRERNLQTLNTFSSCTASQQTSIIEARSHAITASNNAVAIIESVGVSQSTNACPRYKEWFGSYDSSRHTELINGYRTSRDRLSSASIKFDCGCTQK
jgi:peptidyl-Lys metalloendopeptidase